MTTKVVKARRAKEKERVKEKEKVKVKVKEKEREKVKGRKEKAKAKVSGRGEALPCNRSPAKKRRCRGEKMRFARPCGNGVQGPALEAIAASSHTKSRSSPQMASSRPISRLLKKKSGPIRRSRLRLRQALRRERLLCRSFQGQQDIRTISRILVSSA